MAHSSSIYMLDRNGELRVIHDWSDPPSVWRTIWKCCCSERLALIRPSQERSDFRGPEIVRDAKPRMRRPLTGSSEIAAKSGNIRKVRTVSPWRRSRLDQIPSASADPGALGDAVTAIVMRGRAYASRCRKSSSAMSTDAGRRAMRFAVCAASRLTTMPGRVEHANGTYVTRETRSDRRSRAQASPALR